MFEPSELSEIEIIWADLRDLLDWQQGFALYLIFSEDARHADVLLKFLSAWCEERHLAIQALRPLNSGQALHEVLAALPGKPAQPNMPLWLDFGEWSSDPAWPEVRRAVLAALNQRRSWLEQNCQRPLFLHLPHSFAAEVVTWAPDLWSVKRYLAVLPSKPAWQSTESLLDAQVQAALAGEDALTALDTLTIPNQPQPPQPINPLPTELIAKLAASYQLPAPQPGNLQAQRDLALAMLSQAQQTPLAVGQPIPKAFYDGLALLRDLRARAAVIAEATPQTQADIADALLKLADAQIAVADLGQARQSLYAALGIRQRLAASNADISSQTALADKLAELEDATGNSKQALAWREKSLQLQRKLAQTQQESSAALPGLLHSLHKLAEAQAAAGQIILADEHQQEASELEKLLAAQAEVEKWEKFDHAGLANEDAVKHLVELARSLNLWAVLLAQYGKRAWALKVQARALAISEDLARQNFAAYGPDFAMSLGNWSNCLAEAGQRSEALAVIARTVQIYDDLARQNFAVYGPDFAGSLNNWSGYLAAAGQRSEASAAIARAVPIYEDLARQNFAAYGPDLARSLSNWSVDLAAVGQRSEALAAIARAVKIREDLARQNFAAYGPDLARSLNNWSVYLAAADQRSEALACCCRAVKIFEDLARQNFAAYGPDLTRSLSNWSVHLAAAGQRSEALACCCRAVKIYEDLARQNLTAYGPDLARSLNNWSVYLAGAGQSSEALAASARAVKIYEDLARHTPAVHEPELAASLANLASLLPTSEAIPHLQRALNLISPYALPGTTYEQWQQAIAQALQTRQDESPPA